VEQLDILPTVLARLGVEAPTACPGRDLLAEGSRPEHPIFVERDRPPAFRQRAVIAGGKKLIRIEPRDAVEREARSKMTAGTFLYDLERDPGEKTDLFAPGDPAAEQLLTLLDSHFPGARSADGTTGTRPDENVAVDDGTREALRALGYIR
jgi:arylsulfatase A-like enzyme